MAVPGAPAHSGRGQFSLSTRACLCFTSSSLCLRMPKSGCVLEDWGPVPPTAYWLRQGASLGAKSMAQEEPARPPELVSQKQP